MESERPTSVTERQDFEYDYFVVDTLNPRRLRKCYDLRKTKIRRILSATATLVGMSTVIFLVVAIYVLKYAFQYLPEPLQWLHQRDATVISTIQSLQIVLLDYWWCGTVKKLTDFENHRYDRDYQTSFVGKMFLFRFMNNFYALVYIAFARNYIEPCAPMAEGGCMSYFRLQIFTLYLLFFAFNIVEVGAPLVSFYFKERQLIDSSDRDFVELQSFKVKYEQATLVEDHMEIIIQYCAVVFFSVALPIVPLFARLQNLLERAYPMMAPEGLSTYNDIINLIGILTPAVNVALCIFLVPFGSHELPFKDKLLYFILERVREGMRMATHDIVWGNANVLYYGDKTERQSTILKNKMRNFEISPRGSPRPR